MSNARLKIVIAVLLGALTVGATYSMWEWGRTKNFWGTPDEVAALWNLSFVQAVEQTAEETHGGLIDRTQRPNGEFMSKPEPAYIEFSVPGEDEGEPSAKASERLKNLAETHGWAVEENCAENIHWCAQMSDAQGFQLFMTVSDAPEQSVEEKGTAAPLLRVKIFYL